MTGRELIDWIRRNHAEECLVVVQWRDGGGNYRGGEVVDAPQLARVRETGVPYDTELEITYADDSQNAIVL